MTKLPPRTEDQKQKVSDLVYEYLAQVANVHDRRKRRNNARNNFQRAHLRIYSKRHKKRNSRPKSNLHDNFANNCPAYLPFTYEMSNSKFQRPLNIKNIVKDYNKAVNEGRNIARNYVCKALSFGVNSGFLVPTDDKGQMLRVSSNLCLFQIGQNTKTDKPMKKLKSKPTYRKKVKRKRLSKAKNVKSLLKSSKNRRLQVTKETKKGKTKIL